MEQGGLYERYKPRSLHRGGTRADEVEEMQKDLRVLFTTTYQNAGPYDFYSDHTRQRVMMPRTLQPGLRFIKQNIPQIEILEFPTWREFSRAISLGWDVVGFSFYTRETNEILQMAEYARKAGVRELWAGNYGALEPSISSTFDKLFVGYSEEQIARELGVEIGELVHPPLVENMGMKSFGYPLVSVGWLYATRGCPMKCTFCEAPVFAPDVNKISVESVDRVLHYYKERGVQFIIIYDETFGIIPGHAEKVVRLLKKHDLPWGCLTRADILKKNLEEWLSNGLIGVFIGIENVNPDVLVDVKKREKIDEISKVVALLNRRDCFVIGGYIVGFENDTVESVKRDLRLLRQIQPDMLALSILTPYPRTPQWTQLQRDHGIDTSDWSKFDQTDLVWNHPRLSREDARMLVQYGYDLFEDFPTKFIHKFVSRFREQRSFQELHSLILSSVRNRLHGVEVEQGYFSLNSPAKPTRQSLVSIGAAPEG